MTDSTSEHALLRAEWQGVLFAPSLSRRALLALEPTWPCRRLRVRVHRNHPFEYVASALPPFLAFARLEADLVIGDYDDALSLDLDGPADLEVVWLDLDRYADRLETDALADWLVDRMVSLRSRSDAPILLADHAGSGDAAAAFNERLGALAPAVAGLRVCPQHAIREALGDRYFDARMERIAATRLAERAHLETARHMGLQWIPSVVQPRLKAVVFDLDHTLWDGVLGEDGVGGVRISEGHGNLQRRALALADEGLLIGIASKNEDADVVRIFSERAAELPLSLDRVSARAVSWESKAAGVRRIAERLRIGTDAVLFVDDNPGELAAVAGALPGVWTLRAAPDPDETLRALARFPGLLRWEADATDAIRAADLAASELRTAHLDDSTDASDYLASLHVTLGVARDPVDHRARLHSLSNKTNQFNLALARLGEAEVDRRLADPTTPVVALWLSDRLSDSGLIGALFARLDGRTLVVEDLCVSCRALGRGLDDALVTCALRTAIGNAPVDTIAFRHATGPRNGPARRWLAAFAGCDLDLPEGEQTIPWDPTASAASLADLPIDIEHRGY